MKKVIKTIIISLFLLMPMILSAQKKQISPNSSLERVSATDTNSSVKGTTGASIKKLDKIHEEHKYAVIKKDTPESEKENANTPTKTVVRDSKGNVATISKQVQIKKPN